MNESNPRKIKALGRGVRNFDEDVWTGVCRDVIYRGTLAKFSQIADFKRTLLRTGCRMIAEASPSDCRYGIGLGKADPRAQNPDMWRGSNWLGEAIMKVRDELKRKDREETSE